MWPPIGNKINSWDYYIGTDGFLDLDTIADETIQNYVICQLGCGGKRQARGGESSQIDIVGVETHVHCGEYQSRGTQLSRGEQAHVAVQICIWNLGIE